jgi:hypothetical protein
MKNFAITLFMLFALQARANQIDCNGDNTPEGLIPMMEVAQVVQDQVTCPNPKKLRGLCNFVGDITEDNKPQGKYRYMYQRRLLEAACVDLEKDSEEEIGKKISAMWKEYEDTLICNNIQFDVSNGSVIKYAVNMQFDVFISNLATWKVNFNKVDETDGRTVLDYVRDQVERSKGLAIEEKLKQYYTILKDAGAKHKSEL